ncbi:MAG: aldo/keto reductase [Solirubrobacterales bacterium]|nr:aldo/keto reductase [Solirubrobacterales bacterium]
MVQGVRVPKLGLGTWQLTGEDCVEAVSDALSVGYRHIDTARAYGNEAEVGRGLAQGDVDRGEVWLTTKVFPGEFAPLKLRAATEDSLRALGVDHIDLLLLHWPDPDVPLADSLGELVKLRDEGRISHLGLSNFPSALLAEALEIAPVLADQVEFHPYLGQPALLRMAREREVMLTAYSPFARGKVHDDPVLQEIGEAHGKTAGQVALRWLLDQPLVSAIPKASSHERRAQNLAVFDFALGEEERSRIAHLERGGRSIDPSFAPAWD